MYPRILKIETRKDFFLVATFSDNKKKIYDASGFVKKYFPEALRNEVFFNSVKVDVGGFGVSWNDEIDLERYDLYEDGCDFIEENNLQ